MQWKRGDPEAPRVLLPLVYDELRRLARHHLRAERSDHTLQSTALVHEAYLRMVKPASLHLESRQHFFALASQLMREILVDYARGRCRGQGQVCTFFADLGQECRSHGASEFV